MWDIWSHLLKPLTKIMQEKSTFKWKELKQKEIDDIKRVMARSTLLEQPNF